jgi:hypothetical protein
MVPKVLAQVTTTFPRIGPLQPPSTLEDLVRYIFIVTIVILGLLILWRLIRAGISWMLAGEDVKKIEAAKSMIWNAFLGAIIILSSVIFLRTLSSHYTQVSVPVTPPRKVTKAEIASAQKDVLLCKTTCDNKDVECTEKNCQFPPLDGNVEKLVKEGYIFPVGYGDEKIRNYIIAFDKPASEWKDVPGAEYHVRIWIEGIGWLGESTQKQSKENKSFKVFSTLASKNCTQVKENWEGDTVTHKYCSGGYEEIEYGGTYVYYLSEQGPPSSEGCRSFRHIVNRDKTFTYCGPTNPQRGEVQCEKTMAIRCPDCPFVIECKVVSEKMLPASKSCTQVKENWDSEVHIHKYCSDGCEEIDDTFEYCSKGTPPECRTFSNKNKEAIISSIDYCGPTKPSKQEIKCQKVKGAKCFDCLVIRCEKPSETLSPPSEQQPSATSTQSQAGGSLEGMRYIIMGKYQILENKELKITFCKRVGAQRQSKENKPFKVFSTLTSQSSSECKEFKDQWGNVWRYCPKEEPKEESKKESEGESKKETPSTPRPEKGATSKQTTKQFCKTFTAKGQPLIITDLSKECGEICNQVREIDIQNKGTVVITQEPNFKGYALYLIGPWEYESAAIAPKNWAKRDICLTDKGEEVKCDPEISKPGVSPPLSAYIPIKSLLLIP